MVDLKLQCNPAIRPTVVMIVCCNQKHDILNTSHRFELLSKPMFWKMDVSAIIWQKELVSFTEPPWEQGPSCTADDKTDSVSETLCLKQAQNLVQSPKQISYIMWQYDKHCNTWLATRSFQSKFSNYNTWLRVCTDTRSDKYPEAYALAVSV